MKNYITLILGTVLVTGCSVFGLRNSYEEAAHRVLVDAGDFQIRQYEELITANTKVDGSYKESSSKAFDILASYIFGNNESDVKVEMTTPVIENHNQEIAMTVPVFQEMQANAWTMSFVMPSKYTVETLPKPLDKRITLTTVPSKTVAVIRFRGFISEDTIRLKTKELKQWLKNNKWTAISKPYSAAYDPPWTIPFFRRNEIHIEINSDNHISRNDDMYISITGLKIKRNLDLPRFYWHAIPSLQQAKTAEGNISASIQTINGIRHTLTVWESEQHMRDFIYSGSHLNAIKAFHKFAIGKTYGYNSDEVPTWEKVHSLWKEKGKVYGVMSETDELKL